MSELIRRLKKWGAEPDEAVHRMLDDEDFYVHLVWEFRGSEEVSNLLVTADSGNYAEAFQIAHTLKGVTANLSLTPLYQKLEAVVENLRGSRNDPDWKPTEDLWKNLVALCAEYARFVRMMKGITL